MSYRIGELSHRSGVRIETIRYYERIGLSPEPMRTAHGHRRYVDDHVKRLNFVRRCRELGFSLEQIRGFLALVDGGEATCDQVKAITLQHAADIERKLADLDRMRSVLLAMAAECEGGNVPDCPILDTLLDGRK